MEAKVDQREPDRKATPEEASSLKGTLVGVLFIGAVLMVTWFSMFFLYLSRN